MPEKASSSKNNFTPNTAAALSYLLGFITGLYFFLTSKDKFVRFHALQSTITSISLIVLNTLLNSLGLYSLSNLIGIAGLALFIYMIMQAYQGRKFKLPTIGDIAEKNS